MAEEPKAGTAEDQPGSIAEEPKTEHASTVSAGIRRIRMRFDGAGVAARRTMGRLRAGGKASEEAKEPKPEHATIAEEAQRVRTELADAGVAARRTLERVRWIRVTIVAAVQLLMVFIAWRLSVRRARRRRASVQYWAHELPNDEPGDGEA